jgi:uncharacterized membrane protein YvlD (DUF360 family)
MTALRRLERFYAAQLRLLWTWRPGRRALLRRGIVTFAVAAVALAATAWVLPGVEIHTAGGLALAVVFLALLNALVRPVILWLVAPFSVVLVAVATLIFQAVAFLSLDPFNADFEVTGGFAVAFVASWVYAIVNTILTAILSIDSDESFFGTLVRQLSRENVVTTDRPGVVVVQIDGLAHSILAHGIRAGRLPFLSRWVRSREMYLDRWTTLLPSQTSASQAGILHGNNDFIPAFRWWEKDRQAMMVSNHPRDALEIVRRASNGEGLLSNDGASVGNLLSGDAVRSYITMATLEDGNQGLGRSTSFFSFFVSPYNYLHAIVRAVGEIAKELVQARRQRLGGVVPSIGRGMPYPLARAATNVVLRSLSTSLVMEEMFRGAPVIYVDYTDYDEIAHHSGPERDESFDALDGLDRVIGSLVKAAADAPRPYRFIILSDHGQSLGATFLQRYGRTLQAVVAELMGGSDAVRTATARVEEWGPINAFVSEAAQTRGVTGALARRAFRQRTRDGTVELGPSERAVMPGDTGIAEAGRPPAGEMPELVVAASGNLGLISFPRLPGRVSLETLDERFPGLVAALANHPGIGFLMVRSERSGAVAVGADGIRFLDQDRVEGDDPVAPYGEHAGAALRRLDRMEHCGDIVVMSLLDPETDEVAAFEELIGSHGGLGGPQTEAFILHPTDWPIGEELVGAEAVYRQIRRWLEDLGIPLGRQDGTAA